MEIRKVLKKATAVAASASFIGATLLGAVAQDLSTYPSPFVKDGMFDALIVVGADAQPQDVVGAVDIGASLQFSLKKAATTGAAAEATIDSGFKIQTSGDKFNYGDTAWSVLDGASITDEDLPTIFGDGKFVESNGNNKNSETYTQEIKFNQNETINLTYSQDDDLVPKADNYLFIDKNKELYNYSLEFTGGVDYDNSTDALALDDLKTSTLTMQGKTYTITGVELGTGATNGVITKLTLLSGEAVLWLTQNNPIKKAVSGVEHTVEVLDVTEDADACQVKVDDVTAIVDVDETKTINGLLIGITDVRAIHAQLQDVDVCQVSVGATELVLEDNKEVKVDDVEIDGSEAQILDSGGDLNEIQVLHTPRDNDDDIYLAAGQAYTDPIFGSWKIIFGGITAEYEEYSLKTSGDSDATFKFINNDGKTVEIPIFMNGSLIGGVGRNAIFLGEGNDIDERVYAAGNNISINADICNATVSAGTTNVEDCEGMMILATTPGGEAHMFEIRNIDTDDNTTDIKDLTYGKLYEDVSYIANKNQSLDLGSFGTGLILNISEDNSSITVVRSVRAKIETNAGGSISINKTVQGSHNLTINISERNRANGNDIADELTWTYVDLYVQPDTDSEISVDGAIGTNPYEVDAGKDSDDDIEVSRVGTIMIEDEENQDSVIVKMPKAEVYGSVFIAPIVAQVSTAASGVASYTLTKLSVGAAKLDSEISDAGASNLIVVGGPCANKIAASVLGKTYPACGDASGIAKDTAIIKAVKQSSGKIALVVAGWEAIDTKRATRVLANYDQYVLSGSEVTVTGTSLTDIQVKKSA